MIQDIFPDKLDNHFENLTPDADSPMICFRNGKLLTSFDDASYCLQFPVRSDFPEEAHTVYLFTAGGTRYFLVTDPEAVPEGYEWQGLRDLQQLRRSSNTEIFAAFTAFHLWKWYESSRFCGACGHETVFDEIERAKVCPVCGNRIYPRINPAVIVGVINENRLLLTKYKTGFGHNALVAGFTEIGETLEETVQREVMEEVGLKVKNIRYYKSQPWGIALDILAGFFCEVDGDDTIRRDDNELKYAQWVKRDEIELQPTNDSLTNEMMSMFRNGLIHVEDLCEGGIAAENTNPPIISDTASEEEVLKAFLKLPVSDTEGVFSIFRTLSGAVEAHGSGKERYLYIPGTRKDRCVLVAHADTYYDRAYWGGDRIFRNKPILEDGFYQGTSIDASIGADDRSGCAMLWLLRNSGHSLLILDGEEHGQVGAHYLIENDPNLFREINDHTFIIELDRMGSMDYRTYKIPVTDEFTSFIEKETKYRLVPGAGRTDICVLCTRICGVNLSVGYYMEHYPEEMLVVEEWKNTLDIVRKMISKPLKQYKTLQPENTPEEEN